MPKYKRTPPNEWDLLRLMDTQVKGVIAGYTFMTNEVQTQALSLAVDVGIVMLLAGFVESTRVLSRLRPCTALVLARYKPMFDKWERMRDDAAHTAEKLYGSTHTPKRGTNRPWHKSGFRLLHYNPRADTLSTGSDRAGSFKLAWAINSAVSASCKCERAIYLDEHSNPARGKLMRRLDRRAFGVSAKVARLRAEIEDESNLRT